MLGVDDGRPPARIPLVASGHHPFAVIGEQRLVGLIPVRSLPAGRFEEDGAQRLLSFVERAEAHATVRFPLLAWMDDAVGLVESLRGASANVGAGPLMVVK